LQEPIDAGLGDRLAKDSDTGSNFRHRSLGGAKVVRKACSGVGSVPVNVSPS
jgi:hypothetical protein